jgi:FlaG/FlaF family flagellin (archaellin)
MAGTRNDEAVSVIVGTLLLILVTVIAAAGLAIMVSQLQKDEMDRQSHMAAVKSEQVQILAPGLANDPAAWNQTPFNVTASQSWNNWSSVSFTLSNLNTDDVNIIGIAVNDHYSRNFTAVTDIPGPVRVSYNVSDSDYLTIPGTGSRNVRINFTDDFSYPQYVSTGEQVRIKVITSLNNVFEKSMKPPGPVFLTKIETEDLGSMQRRVLVLDGSASTADTAVAGWNWTIVSGAGTTPVPGSWADTTNLSVMYSRGKIVRVTPMDTGPFRISLSVTDDVGMSRTSGPVDVPADPDYVPVSNVYATRFNSTVLNHDIVNVTVKDINGNPVPGITVNFAIGSNPYNNLMFGPYYNITDSSGVATTEIVAGNGTVKVICGKFPVMEVPVGL